VAASRWSRRRDTAHLQTTSRSLVNVLVPDQLPGMTAGFMMDWSQTDAATL
jgi:hypothetical protein